MDVSINFVRRWNFIQKSVPQLPPLAIPAEVDTNLGSGKSTKCQITRSIGPWSGGVRRKESSIFNAMLRAIDEAKTFIYIENQYFISISGHKDLTDKDNNLRNIGDALVHRIQRAFNSREPFKVIIILPSFPEGDPITDNATQRVMYWYVSLLS